MNEITKITPFPVWNSYAPDGGPKAVPVVLDFATESEYEVDFYKVNSDNTFDSAQSIYVDNADNAAALTLVFQGTNQRLVVPAGAQGVWPIISADPLVFTIATTPDDGLVVNLTVMNMPLPFSQWGPTIINQTVNPITQGGLTDRSGTITTGGTSQQLAAANANRDYIVIENPPTEIEPLYINFGSAASATGDSISLLPGEKFVSTTFVSTQTINVVAATTSHTFVAKEG